MSLFADPSPALLPWKVLLVDDEPDIHVVTKLSLNRFKLDDRPLKFFDAYSGAEAKKILSEEPGIALILLDVVMENDDSGLEVVRWLRQELGNKFTRIVLRTGQPGQAPEERVIIDYDINDYKEKTELDRKKLFTTTFAALRAYRDIMQVEEARRFQVSYSEQLDLQVKQRTEELAQAVSRLEKLDKEKNDFLGIAAHDMKNPLNAILGMSELLLSPDQSLRDDQCRFYIECINKSGQHMLHIITNLLNINAFETGHLNFNLSPVDLNKTVREVVQMYENRLKAKNLAIIWSSQDSPLLVSADVNACAQIVDNLISNAIKYSPLNKQIYLNVEQQDGFACMQIRDQGPGLSKADQQHLFEKFTRLSSMPTAGEHSSGLGLSIVKKLSNAMNGDVYCESEVGHGCLFGLKLPLIQDTVPDSSNTP